jgi:hypothetical protein
VIFAWAREGYLNSSGSTVWMWQVTPCAALASTQAMAATLPDGMSAARRAVLPDASSPMIPAPFAASGLTSM